MAIVFKNSLNGIFHILNGRPHLLLLKSLPHYPGSKVPKSWTYYSFSHMLPLIHLTKTIYYILKTCPQFALCSCETICSQVTIIFAQFIAIDYCAENLCLSDLLSSVTHTSLVFRDLHGFHQIFAPWSRRKTSRVAQVVKKMNTQYLFPYPILGEGGGGDHST